MVSLVLQKGWCVLVCFSFVCHVNADVTVEGTVFINETSPIGKTDEDFICATLDWWPPDKCDFRVCSWGNSSLLNLDLNNVALFNAVKAFSPLKMRLGGSLQDRVIYQTGSDRFCIPFIRNTSQLYNYTEGCMSVARWDDLNSFFNRTGAHFTFGLNALRGRTLPPNFTGNATGSWDSTNAASLIRYTVKKGYNVYGWELGNELGGWPILGVGVEADQYANDTIALYRVIQDIYKGVDFKPLIMAPGGIFVSSWFEEYVNKTAGSLDVITHHIYNVGSGSESDESLINKILNASFLDTGVELFENVSEVLNNSATVAWVGESGGISSSGRDGVSNTFVFNFWYLDHLGMAAAHDTKTYCRQTLVGGNYGLLDTTTFVPNPNYYSALLWHRLMGRNVLSTSFGGTRNIRAYAHCARQSQGVSVPLINLDGNTTVQAKLDFNRTIVGARAREEYHLTPMDGNIQSRTVLLNGKALTPDSSGAIPDMEPVAVRPLDPITVDPHSIVFVHVPGALVPACKKLVL